jgi:activator of HSP90 ATPase
MKNTPTIQLASFHQDIFLPTTPLDAYNCIMDERIHASFTSSPAQIEAKEGTYFSAYDGYIKGQNIVLDRGKKIVQKWQAQEDGWPSDLFSEVVYVFTPHGQGCLLSFHHNDFPHHLKDALEKGWHEHYWEPLRYYLER